MKIDLMTGLNNYNSIFSSSVRVNQDPEGPSARGMKLSQIGVLNQMDTFDLSSIVNPDAQAPYTISFSETDMHEAFREDPAAREQAKFKWAIVDASHEYAEKSEWINENATSDDERALKMKALDTTYRENVGRVIKDVASQLDQYFSSGDALLNTYSKEELPDLFDKELFSSHIADMALSSKSKVKNAEEIDTVNAKTNSNFEEMTYSDVMAVIGYINKPQSDVADQSNQSFAQSVARSEIDAGRDIDALGVSETVKERMKEVERRNAEGQLRNSAYTFEAKTYTTKKNKLEEEYKRLSNMLKMMKERVEKLKDQGLFNPENDFLIGILKRQEETVNKMGLLRERISDLDNESEGLEKNKSSIVEKDSYKKLKKAYEDEKEKYSEGLDS